MDRQVRIIGGGLAGCEAAWQIARRGLSVALWEMRPARGTEAHVTDRLAELVCSNSFRSDDAERNAVGLLHEEMRRADSLVMAAADRHKVPAGQALAVDRAGFAEAVQRAIEDAPGIRLYRAEASALPCPDEGLAIVATGPLTAPALSGEILAATGTDSLAFFDAIAPIVYRDSIDLESAWFQSRYDKPGPGGDRAAYLNCPLDRGRHEAFIDALLAAETMPFRDWERDTPYFEGCLPIEVMARRGRDTLRFGPMKPVGLTDPLTDPRTGGRAYAVVQLRQDNALGTLFNIVGFQTKLTHAAQKQVFRLIPGLERARFARLGGIHRNMFLNSPVLLDPELRLRRAPHLRFAGQITGVEGYVESAAIGLLAGRFAAAEITGTAARPPPGTTALGALLSHITGGHLAAGASFQPMNINFGLFPPLTGRMARRDRRPAMVERARADLGRWLEGDRAAAA